MRSTTRRNTSARRNLATGLIGGAVLALALSPLLVLGGARSERGADLPHRAPPAQQDELPG